MPGVDEERLTRGEQQVVEQQRHEDAGVAG